MIVIRAETKNRQWDSILGRNQVVFDVSCSKVTRDRHHLVSFILDHWWESGMCPNGLEVVQFFNREGLPRQASKYWDAVGGIHSGMIVNVVVARDMETDIVSSACLSFISLSSSIVRTGWFLNFVSLLVPHWRPWCLSLQMSIPTRHTNYHRMCLKEWLWRTSRILLKMAICASRSIF